MYESLGKEDFMFIKYILGVLLFVFVMLNKDIMIIEDIFRKCLFGVVFWGFFNLVWRDFFLFIKLEV